MGIHKGNKILEGKEAREILLKGVKLIKDTVAPTLGAKGRNVVYYERGLYTRSSKDGMSIIKEVNSPNDAIQHGVNMAREASHKTVEQAGDGTTSTPVVLCDIIEKGMKYITPTTSVTELKKGIDYAAADMIESIESFSDKATRTSLIQVATIAANNNKELGELVGKSVFDTGINGDIVIEQGKNFKTEVKTTEGVKIKSGLSSAFYITNTKKRTFDKDNVFILLVEGEIEKAEYLKLLTESLSQDEEGNIHQAPPILIVCYGTAGSAEQFLLGNANTESSPFHKGICTINLMGSQTKLIDDLAVLTGATVFGADRGLNLADDFTLAHLGKAKKVICSKNDTLIVGGIGDKVEIDKNYREAQEIANSTQGEEKQLAEQRLALYNGKASTITVGGLSPTDVSATYDLVEDAVLASKSALSKGTVAGGGISYIRAARSVEISKGENEDVRTGMALMCEAVESVYKQLMTNSELEFDLAKIQDEIGCNVKTGEYVNMKEAGILDSAQVLISVINNASSVAGTILLTEVVVSDVD